MNIFEKKSKQTLNYIYNPLIQNNTHIKIIKKEYKKIQNIKNIKIKNINRIFKKKKNLKFRHS